MQDRRSRAAFFVAVLTLMGAGHAEGQQPQQWLNSPVPLTGNPVFPWFEGWYDNGDGTLTISFGYLNRNPREAVEIPHGERNYMEPAEFDGVEHVAVRVHETGRGVLEVVGSIIAEVVAGLRADKNMRWCDPELAYSRPIRWIVALWGDSVVPVSVSGLRSGRTSYGDRTEAGPLIEVENADVLQHERGAGPDRRIVVLQQRRDDRRHSRA